MYEYSEGSRITYNTYNPYFTLTSIQFGSKETVKFSSYAFTSWTVNNSTFFNLPLHTNCSPVMALTHTPTYTYTHKHKHTHKQ